MTDALLVAMPTCDGPAPSVLKNTRSPAWIAARETGIPTPHCWKLVRGTVTPARANAHWTSPLQSNPPGAAPAGAKGVPLCDWAAATAELLPPAPDAPTPSAPSV